MLEYLKIENLALLDACAIEFGGGFTAVTGETGAGKSVLLGALALLAGSRSGREIVKRGRDVCTVEALLTFQDTSKIDEFLSSCGIAECEDNTLLLKRQIGLTKASKCFINNTLTTAAVLRNFGEMWIDFHGTNEPQKLFNPKNQLAMLDAYADIADTLSQYGALFKEYRQTQNKIEELKSARQMSPDELQFARSQIELIDSLNPTQESIGQLEADFKLVENARELTEKSNAINSAITCEGGVQDMLAAACKMASEIAEASDAAQELAARIKNLSVELDDVASDYASLAESCEFSEENAAQIRENMDLWLTLRRKYGASVQMVLAARAKMLEKISLQGDVKSALEQEHSKLLEFEKLLAPLKEKIFEGRKKAALALEKKSAAILKKLGFKKPEFKIELSLCAGFDASGASVCEFMFSANPGQPAMPLSKIASSGELARVMLSLKAVLAEADDTGLLVFDEVDANVGGEIGAELGKELGSLSRNHQVLCVTHLPQVAALAKSHLLVKKFQSENDTSVEISSLDNDENLRVAELARMLGDRNSASATAHARELLKKS